MPTSRTCSHVDNLFTPHGCVHPHCPLTIQELLHGSSDSTFEYCHWVPKHLQNKVPGVHLELDDNAGNFFPTVKLIAQNIELYQRIPNLSLRFKSGHNTEYDTYIVEVNPSLPHNHLLRQSTGAKGDGSDVLVVFPKVSRPFVELHFRVFCTHHGLSPRPWFTIQNDYPEFEELQVQVLFMLIMLDSPFTKVARQATRKPTCHSSFDAPKLDLCSAYPERRLTTAQASKLVGQTIQLSSDLYPNWGAPRHSMEAYIAKHNLQSRTFDIVFPADETDNIEFDRFKRNYRGNGSSFDILVHTQSEAAIIKYGDPLFVQSLEKQFAGQSKACGSSAKRKKKTVAGSTKPLANNGPSSSTEPQRSNGSSSMEVQSTSSVIALPAGVREGRRIRVYWTTRWFEGTIKSIDDVNVEVLYDKHERGAKQDTQEQAGITEGQAQKPEHVHARTEFARLKYALIAAEVAEQEGHETGEGLWMCVNCQLLHRAEADCQQLCCAKCKRLYREVGSARSSDGKRPSRKAATTSNKQSPSGTGQPENETDDGFDCVDDMEFENAEGG